MIIITELIPLKGGETFTSRVAVNPSEVSFIQELSMDDTCVLTLSNGKEYCLVCKIMKEAKNDKPS